MEIVHLALRGAQLVFAVIVLGLSISLAKGQVHGMPPAITIYVIVCGIAATITSLLGIVANFWDDLQGFILFVCDGVSTFIVLAGSIAMAALLGVGTCTGNRPSDLPSFSPNPYCLRHKIIAGGAIKGNLDQNGWQLRRTAGWFESRCRMAQADVTFLYFTLITLFVTTFFSFRYFRGRGKGVSVV